MQAISDIEFGKMAVASGLLKPSHLALCMKMQNEMPASQEKRQSLPEILLAKGYLTTSQIQDIAGKIACQCPPTPTTKRKLESAPADKEASAAKETGEQGESFGRYRLISELGKGGMGCVYKAYDTKLNRVVALKMLLAEGNESDIERFAREAKAMGQLKHPNIVTIYDVGDVAGKQYFTMEFIAGASLLKLIKEGNLTIRQTVEIMIKVCAGIAYSHTQGIIHRDLKPANVMVTETMEPKIMDFGLAKLDKESKKLSQSGMMLGTLYYMPPEQAEGKTRAIDNRSDVYSLGAMLYEAITGRTPFTGNTMRELLVQILCKEPMPPSQFKPTLPNDLDTIVLKALEKQKERRYVSASAMGEDLLRFQRGEALSAKPPGMAEKAWRKVKANRAMSVSIVLCLFCLVALLAFLHIWNDVQRQHECEKYKKQIEQERMKISSTAHAISQKMAGGNVRILREATRQEIEECIQQNMQVHTLLEQANALFPQDTWITAQMGAVERETCMLALLVRNYALSQVFFKRYQKTSCYSEDATMLWKTIQDKRSEIQKAQSQRVDEIMNELEKAPPVQAMADEYVTEIIKMGGEHIVRKLLSFLGSANDWQRYISIESLGKLADCQSKFQGKDSVEWLSEKLDAINLSKQQQEAEMIVWALGRLKDERAEKSVYAIRWKAGQNTIFWKNTSIPYRWIPMLRKTQGKPDDVEGKTAEEASTYNSRALARQDKGDLDGAIVDFTQAIRLQPTMQTYYNRGFAYRLKGDLDNAIADFGHAIQMNPEFAGAYVNRGVAYEEKKDLDNALADYTRAIEIDPQSVQSYNNRGNVRKAKGDIEGAVSDLSQAIHLNPGCAEAYNNRATLYMSQKNLDGAIADYTSAIRINPRIVELYFNRGNAFLRKGDLAKALIDCDHAVQIDPRNYNAYFNRGNVRLLKKDADGAIADYNQAIQLKPMALDAYNNRAAARSEKKDADGAIADYSHIIQANPKYFSAYINRAKLYAQKGDKKRAVADVQMALHLAPDHPNVAEWKTFIQKHGKNR